MDSLKSVEFNTKKLTWKDKLIKLNSFTRGFWNIIEWFSVIWKDRQWDYTYFFRIIEHKLKLLEKHWTSANLMTYEGWEEDLENIRYALKVVDRIIKDDYYLEEDEWSLVVKQKEKDLNLLFSILENNITKWWD